MITTIIIATVAFFFAAGFVGGGGIEAGIPGVACSPAGGENGIAG